MGKDFLSIKDFAEAAGFTPQGIYKRLKDEIDELQQYCKEIDGKKFISAAALSAIFNKEYKPHEQEQPKDESSSTDKVIEILKSYGIHSEWKDIELIDDNDYNYYIEKYADIKAAYVDDEYAVLTVVFLT